MANPDDPVRDQPDTPPPDAVLPDPVEVPPGAPVLIDLPEEPAPEPLPDPAPATPPRRSVLPLLLAGVLTAGAGFALSLAVPQGWPLAVRQDTAVTDRLIAQQAEIQRLSSALAEIPKPVPTDLAPLEARLNDLTARLDGIEAQLADLPAPQALPADLAARLDTLETRLAAVEAAPPGTVVQGGDPAAMAALRADMDRLRQDLQAPDGAAVQQITTAVETAQAALAEVQAEATRLRDEAEAAAQAGRSRAALGRIEAALETGAPYATAVQELSAAGVTVDPALAGAAAQGLPTLASLQDSFPPAARAALDAARRADMGDTAWDRLGSFLTSQTGARSLTPREGTDPDAILSRAEGALAAGDLDTALAEVATLPDPARAALSDWQAQAARRQAALAALAPLTAAVGG